MWARWKQVARTNAKGKVTRKNMRVDFTIPDLVVNTDARAANMEFGEIIAKMVQEELRTNSVPVSDSTEIRRAVYGRQDTSTRSYRRRYTGGRIGETPPAARDGRVLNRFALDSGRLIDSIIVRPRNTSRQQPVATMNVAANRLDPKYWGNVGSFRYFIERLRIASPILAGNFRGKARAVLDKAVEDLADAAVEQKRQKMLARLRRRNREILRVIRAAGGFFG